MSLVLSGEDGQTLYVLLNEAYLSLIKEDLKLHVIDDIWLRPSFGRGAGARHKEDEKGYSGFGEPDAFIIGRDISNKKKIVFLESKQANALNSERKIKELRYQFYLKIALIYGMLHPVKKEFGQFKTEGIYYCVELDDNHSPVSNTLYKYYREYKKNFNANRKNLLIPLHSEK